MALETKEKQKIIGKYRVHNKDTGSPEVQIATLTTQIKKLTGHLKDNPKDNHSRRGLLKMVAKRKKLMDYLKKKNEKSYDSLTKNLSLKRNRRLADKKPDIPLQKK
jgi:small subunit ribosomal protein S15